MITRSGKPVLSTEPRQALDLADELGSAELAELRASAGILNPGVELHRVLRRDSKVL
jgi:hypothetical protein